MKKILKIALIVVLLLALAISILYFIFIYEKPIDQKAINDFLSNQPIIDVHIHATKGYLENESYNQLNSDINLAKIQWMSSELDKNNIVIALVGGSLKHASRWAQEDARFWTGLIFPCSFLVEQDQPCDKEFYNLIELNQIYHNGTLKVLGESLYNYYGIPPTDDRLKPYWQFAEQRGLPIGIHSDSGPTEVNEIEMPNYRPDYADPALLEPVLKKHPNLKVWLMHFGGEYSDTIIKLMKIYPQIYCDMTAVSLFVPKFVWEPNIKKLFNEGLGDRLMFGSDYHGTIRKNIEIVFGLEWLSDEHKRDIYYNNAARFLGLTNEEINKHKTQIKTRLNSIN